MPETPDPLDDPLTERLRAVVEGRAQALPPAPDLPTRIGARVRRRRRQRLALSSSIVAVTVLALLAGALVLVPGMGDDDGNEVATAGNGDDSTTATTDDDGSRPTTTVPGEPGTEMPDRPRTSVHLDEEEVPTTTTTTEPAPEILVSGGTPLNISGIGPIRAGMTVYQAEEAAGVTINVAESASEPGSTCSTGQIEDYGVWVIVQLTGTSGEDQKSGVITTVTEGSSTEEGLQLGDSGGRVTELYNAPTRTVQHPYSDTGGEWQIFESGGYGYAVLVDGDAVTQLQSGRATGIPSVEGCA
jgi:hypothetical protein